jgi:hypothetical protein
MTIQTGFNREDDGGAALEANEPQARSVAPVGAALRKVRQFIAERFDPLDIGDRRAGICLPGDVEVKLRQVVLRTRRK